MRMLPFYKRVFFKVLFILLLGEHVIAMDRNQGVLILGSSEGNVQFYHSSGKIQKRIKAGEVIPSQLMLVTGVQSKVVAVLSNGTVITIGENSRFKLSGFEQEPFKVDFDNFASLEKEPSKSIVTVEVDEGTIVVKTKKLHPQSSLSLISPFGVAEIKGTEFQMSSRSDQGVELDVTESTVSFTPPGAVQPISVSEGNGLSAPPGQVPTLRTINPSVTQSIRTTNQQALKVTADVPIDAVFEALQSQSEKGELGPKGKKLLNQSRPLQNDQSKGYILENNTQIILARKIGRVDEMSTMLAKLGLSESQVLRFYQLSKASQSDVLKLEYSNIHRLLDLDGFTATRADAFFEYRPHVRELVLGLENQVMLTLLDQGFEELLLEESLTKLNLEFTKPENRPSPPSSYSLDERTRSLSERLRNSGNGEIMDDLLEFSTDGWTEEILRTGEVAESLLRDYEVMEEMSINPLELAEVLQNPFYSELSHLYEQLKIDQLVYGEGLIAGGKNLIVSNNALVISPYFWSGETEVVLSASENLNLQDGFVWDGMNEAPPRLVLISAGEISHNQGANIQSATSDLVLATRQNLLLQQISLDAANEVSIRGLRDVSLKDIAIGADILAVVKARNDLDIDGLTFTRDVSRILMEATTMRLRNIDFPALSNVRLNTLYGPIDGKYPNFGTSIPAAQQIGRVNFIENVRSGGNLMNDRPSFDLHGNNIEIGTILKP